MSFHFRAGVRFGALKCALVRFSALWYALVRFLLSLHRPGR